MKQKIRFLFLLLAVLLAVSVQLKTAALAEGWAADYSIDILTEESLTGQESFLADPERDASWYTESAVAARLAAMQSSYPEGMSWTNNNSYENTYQWYGGEFEGASVHVKGLSCFAFSMIMSDAAFGTDLPIWQVDNVVFSNVRVGDILRYNNNSHSVIVLEVNEDSVTIAEGNYNGSIHWRRTLSAEEVESADYLLTRWPGVPEQEEQDDPVAEFVKRSYSLIQNREGEENDIANWTTLLKDGSLVGADIISLFCHSPNFLNRGLDNGQIVSLLYNTMLNRAPEEDDLAYWTQQLNNGVSTDAIISEIAGSPEFAGICAQYGIVPSRNQKPSPEPDDPQDDSVAKFVSRSYSLILGREGEADGIAYWTGALKNNSLVGEDIISEFCSSPEFIGRGLNSGDIVSVLYNTMLNRAPDDAGFVFWTGSLDNGTSTDTIISGFAGSKEFSGICEQYGIVPSRNQEPPPKPDDPQDDLLAEYVKRSYSLILGREGDVGGIKFWTEMLLRGEAAGKEIINMFCSSEEFTERGLSSEEIVTILYRTMLNRDPEEEGLAYWKQQLDNGASPEAIISGLSGSAEFAGICAEFGINP